MAESSTSGIDLNKEFLITGNLIKSLEDAIISKCIPTGTIIEYYGTEIPTGWNICDGTNGTPDLRDKFTITVGPNHPYESTGTETTKTIDDALIVSGSTTSVTSGISYYSLYRIMKI